MFTNTGWHKLVINYIFEFLFIQTLTTFRTPPPTRRPRQHFPQISQKPFHTKTGNTHGFGAPKPQSIIGFNEIQKNSGRRPFKPSSTITPRRPFVENQFVHSPISFPSDNSIIGMLPPPPLFQSSNGLQDTSHVFFNKPSTRPPAHFSGSISLPTVPLRPPPQTVSQHFPPPLPPRQNRPHRPDPQSQVHHAQPVFEQFQSLNDLSVGPINDFQFNSNTVNRPPNIQSPNRPVLSKPSDPSDLQFDSLNSLNSNVVDDLVINKVPPVNAGVLPLAHEQPSQLELFPPFTRRG